MGWKSPLFSKDTKIMYCIKIAVGCPRKFCLLYCLRHLPAALFSIQSLNELPNHVLFVRVVET